MRQLFEFFYNFQIQKRIVPAETLWGNTVCVLSLKKYNLTKETFSKCNVSIGLKHFNAVRNSIYIFLKVQTLREGHKLFIKLPLFWHYLVASNYKWTMGQIFVAFLEHLIFNKKNQHKVVKKSYLYKKKECMYSLYS